MDDCWILIPMLCHSSVADDNNRPAADLDWLISFLITLSFDRLGLAYHYVPWRLLPRQKIKLLTNKPRTCTSPINHSQSLHAICTWSPPSLVQHGIYLPGRQGRPRHRRAGHNGRAVPREGRTVCQKKAQTTPGKSARSGMGGEKI